MSGLNFDSYQFENSHVGAVNGSNGISFEDAARMQTRERRTVGHTRRLDTPSWALR